MCQLLGKFFFMFILVILCILNIILHACSTFHTVKYLKCGSFNLSFELSCDLIFNLKQYARMWPYLTHTHLIVFNICDVFHVAHHLYQGCQYHKMKLPYWRHIKSYSNLLYFYWQKMVWIFSVPKFGGEIWSYFHTWLRHRSFFLSGADVLMSGLMLFAQT